MTTLQLGVGAYERLYAGEPLIRLENRFVEVNPTNLNEKTALLARPGTGNLAYFAGGRNRRVFTMRGLFNSALFVVSGPNLWRYNVDGSRHFITGVVNGDGPPAITWRKGIGYEQLFIADGLLLQYYDGGTHASGVLTSTGAITNQVVRIGDVYYSWSANVNTPGQNGSLANPWLALLDADPLASLVRLIMFAGVPGTDYSATLGGPSLTVTAVIDDSDPTKMIVTAISEEVDGNAIVTTVPSGANLAWGSGTLTGGGVHVLHGITMPDGKPAKSLATVASYVLVSVGRSQQFFWIKPGEVVIDALNFASKESNPDEIIDMMNVGDQAILIGSGSTETWYATGQLDAPVAPVKGRAYQRGMLEGTACVVKENVIFVGDDGIVYQVGSSGSINRISNHGVEERIRVQRLREAAGL